MSTSTAGNESISAGSSCKVLAATAIFLDPCPLGDGVLRMPCLVPLVLSEDDTRMTWSEALAKAAM